MPFRPDVDEGVGGLRLGLDLLLSRMRGWELPIVGELPELHCGVLQGLLWHKQLHRMSDRQNLARWVGLKRRLQLAIVQRTNLLRRLRAILW